MIQEMINLSVTVQLRPCGEIGKPFANIGIIIIKTLNFNELGNSKRIDKSKTEMILESFNSIRMWRVLTFPWQICCVRLHQSAMF